MPATTVEKTKKESADPMLANDSMLAKAEISKKSSVPIVSLMLPVPAESETGVNRVIVETITLNGKRKTLPRGEMIEISVPEYMLLRNKFDKI